MLMLIHLKTAGVLQNLTLEDIGQVTGVNRSTICRDFQELDAVEQEYHRLMAAQPWVPRELTVDDFAERIGVSAETIRYMIRDGLITATKRPGRSRAARWYIPITELDWWLRRK
jgi:excisionase family DNA binding protein